MGFLEERDLTSDVGIREFYKGKTVFITGGTGFMGEILIEKLLYSCSELDRIYILVRPKKGMKPEDRISQICKDECFDRLHRERPGILESKLYGIAGDMMEPGLGISEEDRTLLINRCNIIFHVAASVRFDDPLSYATKLNLRGSKEVVELAKEMTNLRVLVHVSTSYSNTNRNIIEEKIYPPHADWRETIIIAENIDEHLLRVMTPSYLGEIPNTYTFTKQLAEHVMYEQRGKLPIVIMRPSIVIASHEEPVPGWIVNFNGPVGLIVASGKGIMRSVYSDPDLVADYIPVDIAIKSFITVSWIRGIKRLEPTDDIPIYNCCSGDLNPMTMGEIVEVGKTLLRDTPIKDSLWHLGGGITTSKTIHYVKVLLFHLLPAIFVDTVLRMLGRKPLLVKLQRRIYIANLALEYYITRQWKFNNDNFVQLRAKIKEEDGKEFFYPLQEIDKYEYFRTAVTYGVRYLLKQTDEDLPAARKHYIRMYVLDKVVKCFFYGYVLWWTYNTSYVQSFIHTVNDTLFS